MRGNVQIRNVEAEMARSLSRLVSLHNNLGARVEWLRLPAAPAHARNRRRGAIHGARRGRIDYKDRFGDGVALASLFESDGVALASFFENVHTR
jgi:hypothetical protein